MRKLALILTSIVSLNVFAQCPNPEWDADHSDKLNIKITKEADSLNKNRVSLVFCF